MKLTERPISSFKGTDYMTASKSINVKDPVRTTFEEKSKSDLSCYITIDNLLLGFAGILGAVSVAKKSLKLAGVAAISLISGLYLHVMKSVCKLYKNRDENYSISKNIYNQITNKNTTN